MALSFNLVFCSTNLIVGILRRESCWYSLARTLLARPYRPRQHLLNWEQQKSLFRARSRISSRILIDFGNSSLNCAFSFWRSNSICCSCFFPGLFLKSFCSDSGRLGFEKQAFVVRWCQRKILNDSVDFGIFRCCVLTAWGQYLRDAWRSRHILFFWSFT